jgi:MFS family permease
LCTLLALGGYAIYALAVHWALVFAGLVLVMAWKAGAFPTTFAVIGDALPPGQRVLAFSVQSILVRVPRVLGAPLGGLLIAALGIGYGVRVGLVITLLLALAVLVAQGYGYHESEAAAASYERLTARQLFRRMPVSLKRLLLAECLVRFGEALAAAFIALYVLNVLGRPATTYGSLYALQQFIALASYLPSGAFAKLTGRRPLIALTFFFFALFPLAVQWAQTTPALVAAFVIGGLKEVGEPARKALIVDQADAAQRGRVVGIYYTIRNSLIVPGGVIGGLLWTRAPELPLQVAGVIGLVGVLVFWFTSEKQSSE